MQIKTSESILSRDTQVGISSEWHGRLLYTFVAFSAVLSTPETKGVIFQNEALGS